MGYNADIVSGFGYKFNTCDLMYEDEDDPKLLAWDEIAHQAHIANHPDLMVIETGDSRAPMPDQAYILVLKHSVHDPKYQATSEDIAKLDAAVSAFSLTFDEGPAYFEGTFVV